MKGPDRFGEAVRRRQDRFVADVLPGLLGEQGMDAWRFAVADGIADYGVAVSHSVGSQAVGVGEGPGAGDLQFVRIFSDRFGKPRVGRGQLHDAPRRVVEQ
jgi:hypothetical protein